MSMSKFARSSRSDSRSDVYSVEYASRLSASGRGEALRCSCIAPPRPPTPPRGPTLSLPLHKKEYKAQISLMYGFETM